MLPDHEIAARLHHGDLRITPQPDLARLQPASVDVTLGDTYRHYIGGAVTTLADIDDNLTAARRIGRAGLVLQPGDFVLATTAEHFEIPADLCAFLHGRSTLGRLGIAIHVTAGLVDPGFSGSLTLEVANIGPLAVHFYTGDVIGQVTFEQLDSPVSRPYGHPDLASKYQNQVGATAPLSLSAQTDNATVIHLNRQDREAR